MSFLISIKLVNFAIFIFHITKTEESVNAKSFMWTTFFHEKLYNPPIRALIRWTENKSCQLSHATAIKSKNMNFSLRPKEAIVQIIFYWQLTRVVGEAEGEEAGQWDCGGQLWASSVTGGLYLNLSALFPLTFFLCIKYLRLILTK